MTTSAGSTPSWPRSTADEPMSGGVDTTVVAAFAVGFVSFISPCVLPLVPGYLSAVSGVSIAEIQQGAQRRVLLPATVFCLSFTVVFVALGMSATGIGSTLNDHRDTLETIAGVLIILMGIFFVLTPFVPRLNREWRVDALMQRAGNGGPLVAGAAFAIAWTPCVGPTLGSILTAAATQDTVSKGGLLLAAYSAGLAVPFLVTAVAFTRATAASKWLRDRYVIVTAVSGAILIGMGFLLLSGELTDLNIEARKLLSHLGLDDLYDL
jgi:cytochrome c-type biogenesis protein